MFSTFPFTLINVCMYVCTSKRICMKFTGKVGNEQTVKFWWQSGYRYCFQIHHSVGRYGKCLLFGTSMWVFGVTLSVLFCWFVCLFICFLFAFCVCFYFVKCAFNMVLIRVNLLTYLLVYSWVEMYSSQVVMCLTEMNPVTCWSLQTGVSD